jgi:predicted kinase
MGEVVMSLGAPPCRRGSPGHAPQSGRILLERNAVLIIFGGLPGVGKTTIARELARRIGAVHLRIDSIEQAIRDAVVGGQPIGDAGYRVAYAVAEDNLQLGRTVIADCVNPWPLTRRAWADVARRAGVPTVEIEIVCSNAKEHRRRVETRTGDVPGMALPSWEDVVKRDYRPWDTPRLILDTAVCDVEDNVQRLRDALGGC